MSSRRYDKYFLYRHIRLDRNEPFYIGVGTKKENYSSYEKEYRRAYEKTNRTNYWHNIVNLCGYEVEILMESDNYDFILQKEIEFIKLYGRKDNNTGILVNNTDGGEKNLGKIVSSETRDKKSQFMKDLHSRGKLSYLYTKIPVYQYDLEGNFIKLWDSGLDAEIDLIGKTTGGVNKAIHGKFKTYLNFIWSTKSPGIFDIRIIDLDRKDRKKVYRYDLDGNYIDSWKNVYVASEGLSINSGNIKAALYSKNSSAGGFQWSFILKDNIGKLSSSHRAKNSPIIKVDNGEIIEYKSIVDAAKEFKEPSKAYSNICKVLSGKNSTAYGFIWKYKTAQNLDEQSK